MKALRFTTVFGKELTFDDHNQAGRYAFLQTVRNRAVTVGDVIEAK